MKEMNAKPVVILAACFLLCASSSAAAGDCPPSSIEVAQSVTKVAVNGQPKYAVRLRNTCRCAQSNVKVARAGFGTTLPVDPGQLRPVGGGLCLLNGGRPMKQGQFVAFFYAWSKQFAFRRVSSTVAC